MPDEKRRPRGLRLDPSELLLEIVSIVIAVTLALAVNEAVQSIQAANRTHEALVAIRQEIDADEKELRTSHDVHVRVKNAFEQMVNHASNHHVEFDAMLQTFKNAAPRGFNPFSGTTTAWDLARGSDVLANVPYSVRSAIQTRYADLQNVNLLNNAMISRLEVATTEERPNFYYTAFALRLILNDIDFSEQNVKRDDAAALDALEKDGIHS